MVKSLSFRNPFLFMLCCGLLIALAGCRSADSEKRGVSGDDPTAPVSALIYRYGADQDFMELCSPELDEKTVRAVMDKMVAPDWRYLTCEEDPEEFDIPVGENEYLVVFSGGEWEKADGGTIVDTTRRAYAIIAQDDETGNYIINGLSQLDR